MSYSSFFSFEWQTLPEDALEDLSAAYGQAIQSVIYQVVKDYTPQVQQWMFDNAPWSDITGEARKGLVAKAHLVFNEQVILRISHSVVYGTYLEGWNPKSNAPMQNAGEWAIIEPALNFWGATIWDSIRNLVEG